MTQKEDAQRSRKEQIIDAATVLFAEQGYYKTTTAQVAGAIGVTQPYVFHFFPSKEALFLAVLERAVNRIYEAFVTVDAPPEQLAETMGRAFERLMETHRDEMLLAMQAYAAPEPAIRDFARDRFAFIYRTVRDRFGQAGHPEPGKAASMFIGSGLLITLSEVLGLPELSPWGSDC